jgi:uncharacterized protein (DUF1330 family)
MAAYLVVEVHDVSDGDAMMRYVENVTPLVTQFGGKYLSRGPAHVLEGDHPAQMLVIIEFPNQEQLNIFYTSGEYAPLIELRQRACDSVFLAVDGL